MHTLKLQNSGLNQRMVMVTIMEDSHCIDSLVLLFGYHTIKMLDSKILKFPKDPTY